ESPAEILGEDGKVVGLKTERTQLDGTGNVKGTGEYKQWDVQAIYRAVGYRSGDLADIPFDEQSGTIPNLAGRVLSDGQPLPGVYVTGWIKRGPVGLIGHTKGDANETVACLLADRATLTRPAHSDPGAVLEFLTGAGIAFTTWDGWYRLDAHERALGAPEGRDRVKVVERADMLRASRC
ncbi:pyridine nucleotide-disulfide oxidoreductase, partial [Nocardia rhizosphaerae]